MTYQDHFTLPIELLEQVTDQGLDFLPELIRIVINYAMQLNARIIWGLVRMSAPTNGKGMPMASSLKRSAPG